MDEFSSFRDPSGFVFMQDGAVYRQVNKCYEKQYRSLMDSGLYKELTEAGLLIPHEETQDAPRGENGFLVIRPEKVPYISYPYEWSFAQLKDAALTTLKIHKKALVKGMILKDASAYNIQFVKGRALFIDTLSFEIYEDGMPWVAYGQFCRHFLAPLMLSAHVDVRLSQLLRVYIDGVPLDLAAALLGRKGGMAGLQHIVLHARSTQKHGQDGKEPGQVKKISISRFNHMAMIDSLIRTVEKLGLKGVETEWGDYYAHTNYSGDAAKSKETLVQSYLDVVKPANCWDFGANDGRYSRLALKYGGFVAAFDYDPVAVERSYNAVKASKENMLPLLLDLTCPSPAIGFANKERVTIGERQRPDCILMLAVIHHLAISNNLPFEKIADWVAELSDHLIIEFVPKSDSQVKTLLATRDDIFPNYTKEGFEAAFGARFDILRAENVAGSERTLYLLGAKERKA